MDTTNTVETLWLLRNHVLPKISDDEMVNFAEACPLLGQRVALKIAKERGVINVNYIHLLDKNLIEVYGNLVEYNGDELLVYFPRGWWSIPDDTYPASDIPWQLVEFIEKQLGTKAFDPFMADFQVVKINRNPMCLNMTTKKGKFYGYFMGDLMLRNDANHTCRLILSSMVELL